MDQDAEKYLAALGVECDSPKESHAEGETPSSVELFREMNAAIQEMPIEPLVGDRPPQTLLKKEKPEHRIMTLLKAQGYSNKEIADLTGYTPVMVGLILRQPACREHLLKEVHQTGRAKIAELLATHAADSVFTIVDIMHNGAKDSDKLNAAKAILQQYIGVPPQHVEIRHTDKPPVTELAEIEAELAKIEAEEKQLRGN